MRPPNAPVPPSPQIPPPPCPPPCLPPFPPPGQKSGQLVPKLLIRTVPSLVRRQCPCRQWLCLSVLSTLPANTFMEACQPEASHPEKRSRASTEGGSHILGLLAGALSACRPPVAIAAEGARPIPSRGSLPIRAWAMYPVEASMTDLAMAKPIEASSPHSSSAPLPWRCRSGTATPPAAAAPLPR